jgi:transmembrane sensor
MPEMDKEQIKALLQRYATGECTPEEKALVEYWFYTQRAGLPTETEIEADLAEIWRKVQPPSPVRRLWPRIAAAASILLALSITGYELLHKPGAQQIAQNHMHDIAPGGNKAILTLANGQKIILTDLHSGKVAQQSNMQISKTNNGKIIYIVNKSAASVPEVSGNNKVAYNTITTPAGGTTSVILSDGTVAYLDALSSIHFPITFNGKDREVEITGQVYFEVVHNAKQPFRVKAENETIEDIGTHFNVNAYDKLKVTITEGSVKVGGRLVKPGEQATATGDRITIESADVEQAIAWKNGYFRFNSENIQTIMTQLNRWYNIDVQYEGKQADEEFSGTISRYKNISQVLNMLSYSGSVHFKIDGRRVTVIR